MRRFIILALMVVMSLCVLTAQSFETKQLPNGDLVEISKVKTSFNSGVITVEYYSEEGILLAVGTANAVIVNGVYVVDQGTINIITYAYGKDEITPVTLPLEIEQILRTVH